MKIHTKQVKINKTIDNTEIEKVLFQYGEPLRWAIVEVLDNEFIIDGVFIEK